MKDKNWWVLIAIIFFMVFFLVYLGSRNNIEDSNEVSVYPPEVEEGVTTCTDAQKAAEICTMDYTPVCGEDGETYSNVCSACSSDNIDSYTEGECAGNQN